MLAGTDKIVHQWRQKTLFSLFLRSTRSSTAAQKQRYKCLITSDRKFCERSRALCSQKLSRDCQSREIAAACFEKVDIKKTCVTIGKQFRISKYSTNTMGQSWVTMGRYGVGKESGWCRNWREHEKVRWQVSRCGSIARALLKFQNSILRQISLDIEEVAEPWRTRFHSIIRVRGTLAAFLRVGPRPTRVDRLKASKEYLVSVFYLTRCTCACLRRTNGLGIMYDERYFRRLSTSLWNLCDFPRE